MHRSVVVLPQPLGPSRETNSPSATVNDTGPTIAASLYRLTSALTSRPLTRGPSGLAEDLLVPAIEIRAAEVVDLLPVELHGMRELLVGHPDALEVRRQRRLATRGRVLEQPRHLQLVLRVEGLVHEPVGGLEHRGALHDHETRAERDRVGDVLDRHRRSTVLQRERPAVPERRHHDLLALE